MVPITRARYFLAAATLALTLSGCAPSGATSLPAAANPNAARAAAPAARRAVVTSAVSAPATPAVPAISAVSLQPPPPISPKLQTQPLAAQAHPSGLSAAVVRGTSGQGLWIRTEPGGEPVMLWPEGASLAVVGDEQPDGERRWAPVLTPDGRHGWAASEYLGPADASSPSALRVASDGATPTTVPSVSAPPVAQLAQPTPKPAPPAPAAKPASATAPALPPPVSQMDPLLTPAYWELVGLPKIGQSYAEMIKKSGVHLAVGDLAGAWGQFAPKSNVITIDPTTLLNDPRAVAAVMAHELTHATQGPRGVTDCIEMELEATKVGVNIWESFWSNEIPPRRTKLEVELGEWLVRYREGGDPGMRAVLKDLYRGECGSPW
jgi:hypothetical protein